jgi:hypothetical protein
MATATAENAMMMRGKKRRGASDARMAMGRGEKGEEKRVRHDGQLL